MEKGGDTFWLSSRTIANVIQGAEDTEIYALDLVLKSFSNKTNEGTEAYTSPVLIGKIPSKTAGNYRYNANTGNLVFSAYVYPDGNLSTVAEQDKAWDERGNTALVYDSTYVRHWDEWQGKKGPQLFSTKINQSQDGNWALDNSFSSPLQGTKHVSITMHGIPHFSS